MTAEEQYVIRIGSVPGSRVSATSLTGAVSALREQWAERGNDPDELEAALSPGRQLAAA